MSEIKTSHYKIRSPLSRPCSLFPWCCWRICTTPPSVPAMSGFCRRSGRRIPGRAGGRRYGGGQGETIPGGRCGGTAGELTRRYPVFYANGNHEDRLELKKETFGDAYQNYMEEIQSLGVRLLMNTSQQMEINR